MSEENRRYAARNEQDRRTLAELKKILEIEGLLDTYGHLLEENNNGRTGYPVNNYSGLNSLRARLKNRHWNGKSPFDTMETGTGEKSSVSERPDTLATGSTTFIYAGGECIGAPVYFFFNLNTARLTDASQILNLDELARVANKYGLSVRVTGAADSATGTSDINGSLSVSRAAFIPAELEQRGIPAERIAKVSRGGIADHTPAEANRHTKVELFFSEAK